MRIIEQAPVAVEKVADESGVTRYVAGLDRRIQADIFEIVLRYDILPRLPRQTVRVSHRNVSRAERDRGRNTSWARDGQDSRVVRDARRNRRRRARAVGVPYRCRQRRRRGTRRGDCASTNDFFVPHAGCEFDRKDGIGERGWGLPLAERSPGTVKAVVDISAWAFSDTVV